MLRQFYQRTGSFVLTGAATVAARLFTASPQAVRQKMSTLDEPKDVLHTQSNGIATIILNRPKALNSLSLGMIQTMIPLYQEWYVYSPKSTASVVSLQSIYHQ